MIRAWLGKKHRMWWAPWLALLAFLTAARLWPQVERRLPIRAERVIRGDGFCCPFPAKDHHFVAQNPPYLNRRAVKVRFANLDPESPGGAGRTS